LNDITCLSNFISIYQLAEKLIRGTHTQNGDLVGLFPLLESRLVNYECCVSKGLPTHLCSNKLTFSELDVASAATYNLSMAATDSQ
jgi:hypothetical protein